ncbi:MAG: hypothetical protein E2O61_15600 [Gammaproteobacteria bacterium]|nr:MAG: hypothetical protein E2O61_15600 [Gammaproteobacteria bacterium]
MDDLLKLTFVTGLIILTACAAQPRVSTLDRPDKDVYVDIDPTCDSITAQTRNKTCDGYLDLDPEGLVCQEPTDGPDRFIIWDSQNEFKLEFPNGHPFVNLMGRCIAATLSKSKRCRVKTGGNTTKDYFKYNIVFTSQCKRDPHILIRR